MNLKLVVMQVSTYFHLIAVYATCHNSSTSPWTPCSQPCGLGISTRFTETTAGCNQLINLRLCENRKCETTPDLGRRGSGRDDLSFSPNKYINNGIDTVATKHHHKFENHLHRNHEHHKTRVKVSLHRLFMLD